MKKYSEVVSETTVRPDESPAEPLAVAPAADAVQRRADLATAVRAFVLARVESWTPRLQRWQDACRTAWRPVWLVVRETRAWHVVKTSQWGRYHRPAFVCAAVLMGVVFVGGLFKSAQYKASASLSVVEQSIKNEWDLLKDETREVDFEEQIKSRAVLEPVVRRMWEGRTSRVERPAWLAARVESFRNRLTVERLKHSGILRLTVTGKTPDAAADGANAVAESFLDHRRRQAVDRSRTMLAAVNEELGSVQERLSSLTGARTALLTSHGWENYQSEVKNAQQRVVMLKSALRSLEVFGHEYGLSASSRNRTLESGAADAAGFGETATVMDSALVELSRQLAETDTKLSYSQSRYKEGNPLVVQAQREKAVLQERLSEQLHMRSQALQSQLTMELDRLQALLAEEATINALDLEIAHANQRYQQLLTQRDQIHLALTVWSQPSGGFENLTVLDRAVPPLQGSIVFRFVKTLLAAVAAGLLGFLLLPIILGVWDATSVSSTAGARHASNAFDDKTPDARSARLGFDAGRPAVATLERPAAGACAAGASQSAGAARSFGSEGGARSSAESSAEWKG